MYRYFLLNVFFAITSLQLENLLKRTFRATPFTKKNLKDIFTLGNTTKPFLQSTNEITVLNTKQHEHATCPQSQIPSPTDSINSGKLNTLQLKI